MVLSLIPRKDLFPSTMMTFAPNRITCSLVLFFLLISSLCNAFQVVKQPKLKGTLVPSKLFYRSEADELHDELRVSRKQELLEMLQEVPTNAPTPTTLTRAILDKVKELEEICPTEDEMVPQNLQGSWTLLWTAQDKKSSEWRRNPVRAYINPLENQSYSNNPDGDGDGGRANPILPRFVQDRLERMGLLRIGTTNTRSSQTVDLKSRTVKNVVTLELPQLRPRFRRRRGRRQAAAAVEADDKPKPPPRLAALTVNIRIAPSEDPRKFNVKFNSCKLKLPGAPIAVNFPLGLVGPRGWLRTDYIDQDLRITRGHKGSVFILERPKRRHREV